MPSAKEEKYMETKKAIIERTDSNTYLILEVGETPLKIVLTEDYPNDVKNVFNNLLKELKKGLFQINIEDEIEDLYHNICTEYLTQLNSELKNIYDELGEFGLLQK